MARLAYYLEQNGRLDKDPLCGGRGVEVVGLLEPEEGVLLVCSTLVGQLVQRPAVLSPGRQLRESKGRI